MPGGAYSGNQPAERQVAAVYLGWNIWRMAFWAEIDYILEAEGPDDVNRWAGHGEVNWLVADWLNF